MFEPNPVVEAHKAFDDMIAERRKTRCVNIYESICICKHIISPRHPALHTRLDPFEGRLLADDGVWQGGAGGHEEGQQRLRQQARTQVRVATSLVHIDPFTISMPLRCAPVDVHVPHILSRGESQER